MFAPTRYPRTVGRRSPNRPAAFLAGLVLAVLHLSACAAYRYTDLLNPTVKVEVEHPPSVGFVVDQVVFASDHSPSLLESLGFSGPTSPARCGAELVQALTQVLIEGGLQVAHAERGGDADALITVNVTRCDTEQDTTQTSREIVETVRDNTRRRTVPEYHARTRVSFRATFEVTDLSTGLVAVSRVFAREPETTYSSDEGYPEFPSAGDVAEGAYASVVEAIIPMFFHWGETRELVFFDDENCGFNTAYRAVRAGDFERALEISIANVESCQPDPATDVTERDVAAAHYNVGILYRIRGDFDSAKLSLEQALATDPDNGVVRRAIGETLSAEAAAAGVNRAGRIRRFRRQQFGGAEQEGSGQ